MENRITLPLIIALVVSLMVNMFFVGAATSLLRRHPDFAPGPEESRRDAPGGKFGLKGPSPLERMTEVAHDMPVAAQATIMTAVAAHEKPLEEKMHAMRALFEDMNGVLTAPVFDQAAFAALQKRLGAADSAVKAEMETMLASIAGSLPAKERAAFFKRLMPPFGHPNKGPDRDSGRTFGERPHDRRDGPGAFSGDDRPDREERAPDAPEAYENTRP